jgi:glucose-1-phosphate cytidylyltransferase
MKHYAHHGLKEFVVALGYRGEVIKRWFLDMAELDGSFTLSLGDRRVVRHDRPLDDWKLALIDTGVETQTGGRLAKVAPLLRTAPSCSPTATASAIWISASSSPSTARAREARDGNGSAPPARFGGLNFSGDLVQVFTEKPQIGEGWINGGFFVLEPGVLDYIAGDETPWEYEPLERLAADGQLVAYRHDDFWQCMDTLRDVRLLEGLWQTGEAPWKVWDGG